MVPDPSEPPLNPVPESPALPAAEGSPALGTAPRRSPVKRQTIQLLRTTIQALEGVVERLETDPAPDAAIATGIPQIPENMGPVVAQVQAGWRLALGKIRGVLPRSLHQRMSDGGLTGAIVATLLLVILITPILRSPPPPAVVAVNPSPQPMDSPRPFLAPLPRPAPAAAPQIPTPPTSEPSPAPDTPSQPKTPLPAEPPLPSASPPVPAPQPTPVNLSPEQKLIAAIQDQVTMVSNAYVEGLVPSVQANFRRSLLRVTLGDGWYGLAAPQQDHLAQDICQRAQALDFSKLELVNAAGDRLARSPVVGSEMIILQRTSPFSPG